MLPFCTDWLGAFLGNFLAVSLGEDSTSSSAFVSMTALATASFLMRSFLRRGLHASVRRHVTQSFLLFGGTSRVDIYRLALVFVAAVERLCSTAAFARLQFVGGSLLSLPCQISCLAGLLCDDS